MKHGHLSKVVLACQTRFGFRQPHFWDTPTTPLNGAQLEIYIYIYIWLKHLLDMSWTYAKKLC